jgi:hypothetical protein
MKTKLYYSVSLFVVSMAFVFSTFAQSRIDNQVSAEPRSIFFSTEEEFVTQGSEPADGNPIISDGDLLMSSGIVYMRNKELLQQFITANEPELQRFDFGLDAADVILEDKQLVAFSTSLDHPRQQFVSGDLLITNGALIPNQALLANFNLPVEIDLGLDAVHFLGVRDSIVQFIESIRDLSRDEWLSNPKLLSDQLREFQLDILISTEGTSPMGDRVGFLDGDLLSVVNGTIYLSNYDALPTTQPAGIPKRGVDFGMDAFTQIIDQIEQISLNAFSTEINGFRSAFTDGDALLKGNGVIFRNIDLIGAFEPNTQDLGLDALSVPAISGGQEPGLCQFTQIGGVYVNASHWDYSTGYVDPDLSGRKDYPFGGWVSIRAELSSDAVEHRVVVRDSDGNESPILMPATTGWRIWCFPLSTWHSIVIDGDGWMNTSYYKNILRDYCGNPDLILVNWRTRGVVSNGTYTLILQIKDASNAIINCHEIPVVIENDRPEIIVSDDHECQEYKIADMPLDITGAMRDAHYSNFRLTLDSHWLSTPITFSNGYYYSHSNLDMQGTLGYPTPVSLGTLDIPALLTSQGLDVISGRYTVNFWAWDRVLVGAFTPKFNWVRDANPNTTDRDDRFWDHDILNFEFENN